MQSVNQIKLSINQQTHIIQANHQSNQNKQSANQYIDQTNPIKRSTISINQMN